MLLRKGLLSTRQGLQPPISIRLRSRVAANDHVNLSVHLADSRDSGVASAWLVLDGVAFNGWDSIDVQCKDDRSDDLFVSGSIPLDHVVPSQVNFWGQCALGGSGRFEWSHVDGALIINGRVSERFSQTVSSGQRMLALLSGPRQRKSASRRP